MGTHRDQKSETGTQGEPVKGKAQKESDSKDPAYDKPQTFGKGWKK